MKAAIFEKYGPPEVLRLKEIENPVPKKNEVLVKVNASKINFGDITVRNFKNIKPKDFSMPLLFYYPTKLSLGIWKPRKKILGSEFSGIVESIGADVKKFKSGDKVFGYKAIQLGANAEYLTVPENGLLSPMPKNLSFEEASAVPYGALTALSHFRKLNIKKGQSVLVIGACGSIGSFAVQLAKYYGAEVTGVCSSSRLDYVKDLGSDFVIDYSKEDFTENGKKYDFIYDVLRKSSFEKCKSSLTENGFYVLVSFKTKQLLQMLLTSFGNDKKVKCLISNEKNEDLRFIKEMVEKGELKTSVDKIFQIEQISEAHKYYESGLSKSNVVLKVS